HLAQLLGKHGAAGQVQPLQNVTRLLQPVATELQLYRIARIPAVGFQGLARQAQGFVELLPGQAERAVTDYGRFIHQGYRYLEGLCTGFRAPRACRAQTLVPVVVVIERQRFPYPDSLKPATEACSSFASAARLPMLAAVSLVSADACAADSWIMAMVSAMPATAPACCCAATEMFRIRSACCLAAVSISLSASPAAAASLAPEATPAVLRSMAASASPVSAWMVATSASICLVA